MRSVKRSRTNGRTACGTPYVIFASVLILALCRGAVALAEIKTIEADSVYVMGDNDSKVDARRIATQEAKRKALERAGTYVESLTEVKNYQLTRDEVKAYTAGILETEIVADEMRGTVEHPEIYIKARCRVDTSVFTARIDAFRENEDLKEQVEASAKENDELTKERDSLVRQLQAEKDKSKADETRKQLNTVLAKSESNDETHAVWVAIGAQLYEVDENGREIRKEDLDRSSSLLQRAVATDPQNQRARFMLAAIYERNGNYAGAEDQLRTAIRHNPSNPILHLKLGVVLREQKQYEDALGEFHFVERVRPHSPLMLFYTGMTFKDLDQCGKAVPYLERFVRDPRSNRLPKRKELAAQTVENCGGGRGRFQRRMRYR